MSRVSQREDKTCLKHCSGLHRLYLDHNLFYGCVCIVHINNSTRVTCIVCNCTLITLANSLNNISTSRSSSSRSSPQKKSDLTPWTTVLSAPRRF